MATCKLVIKDEVNIKLEGLPPEIRRKLVSEFKYEIPGARFMPQYKLGRWDGTVSFFGIGGDGYLNHLDKMLPVLEKNGYEIGEIEDRREKFDLSMEEISGDFWGDTCWAKGHPFEGEPIRLREHQVEVVNTFLSNPQSLQSVATSAGKCLAGCTEIVVKASKKSPVRDYLEFDVFDDTAVVKFDELAEIVEKITKKKLKDNKEVDIKKLELSVDTPLVGFSPINYFIKKENLKSLEISVKKRGKFRCAENHILLCDASDIFAKDLRVGEFIDVDAGEAEITKIEEVDPCDCFDIGIDSPHIYYDAAGILHHNTIITATLSKITESYGRSIIIVPNKSLVVQTEADYINTGLDVGVYFGDRKDIGKTHTVCTWQSLQAIDKSFKQGKIDFSFQDFIQGVSTVIVDESHKISGKVLREMLTREFAHVPIRWGLTGTIPKVEHEFQALLTSIGPVVGEVRAKDLQEKGILSNCHINIVQLQDHVAYNDWQTELKYLTTTPERIKYISAIANKARSSGTVLILVDRIECGELIVNNIPDCHFVYGGMKTNDRKDIYDKINVENNSIAVATYGVASTGISISNLHHVILIEPGKSFVRVIQSIGRGLRKSKTKDFVSIWDITSTCKYSKRHLTERKKYYKEAGYDFSIEKVKWSDS